MLKPITLHPSSVLVGLGLAAMVAVLTGAVQSVGGSRPVPTELRIVGHIPASWWTRVTVTPTSPFTVPPDRYFVVTMADFSAGSVQVDGNGIDFMPVQDCYYWGADISRDTLTRLSFPPGTVLTIATWSSSSSTLWGYLEPVN